MTLTSKQIRAVLLPVLLVFCAATLAQSNIRLNNYWENTHFINPASTNEKYLVELTAAARKQWMGFGGSPQTMFATATFYNEKKNTQWGLNAFSDKLGYTSTYHVNLSYAYSILFKSNWQLHLGVGAGYQGVTFDISKIDLSRPDDPAAFASLEKSGNFNADLGAELTNRNWKIGLSGQHIVSLLTDVNSLFRNTNFAYVKYRNKTQNLFELGGGVAGIQSGKILQMELNATGYIKTTQQKDLLNFGLIYRTKNETGAFFGINLNDSWAVSYYYDYNFSSISRSSYGTHELMMIYRFNKKNNCRCE